MDRQCPGCNLQVAIGDPEARLNENVVYHSGCLKKKLAQLMPYAKPPVKLNARVRPGRQLHHVNLHQ